MIEYICMLSSKVQHTTKYLRLMYGFLICFRLSCSRGGGCDWGAAASDVLYMILVVVNACVEPVAAVGGGVGYCECGCLYKYGVYCC